MSELVKLASRMLVQASRRVERKSRQSGNFDMADIARQTADALEQAGEQGERVLGCEYPTWHSVEGGRP